MAHKPILAAAGLVVALLLALAPTASAQGSTECLFVTEIEENGPIEILNAQAEAQPTIRPVACATPQPYPGPFVDRPPATAGPLGWGVLSITIAPTPAPGAAVADSDSAATQGADGRSLPIAHTGTESYMLAYLGTGLVAFGAAALGMRRRYFFADDEY